MVGFQGLAMSVTKPSCWVIEALIGTRMRVTTVFAGGLDRVVGFPDAARFTARHLPTIAAWRALRRADALVSAAAA